MRTKFYFVIAFLVITNAFSVFLNHDLSKRNELLNKELHLANANLELQNQKIQELSVEVKPVQVKEVERIRKIYIKDNTCESQLKAYKELFDENN